MVPGVVTIKYARVMFFYQVLSGQTLTTCLTIFSVALFNPNLIRYLSSFMPWDEVFVRFAAMGDPN